MGQAFDAERLALRGQAFLVEGGVGRSSSGNGSYSVSGTGTAILKSDEDFPDRSLPGHLIDHKPVRRWVLGYLAVNRVLDFDQLTAASVEHWTSTPV
jgi:hypothetical protein